MAKQPKRARPPKRPSKEWIQTWRIVDGAIRDTFRHHPEYLAKGIREADVRISIAKRTVGLLTSFAEQSARGRPGKSVSG